MKSRFRNSLVLSYFSLLACHFNPSQEETKFKSLKSWSILLGGMVAIANAYQGNVGWEENQTNFSVPNNFSNSTHFFYNSTPVTSLWNDTQNQSHHPLGEGIDEELPPLTHAEIGVFSGALFVSLCGAGLCLRKDYKNYKADKERAKRRSILLEIDFDEKSSTENESSSESNEDSDFSSANSPKTQGTKFQKKSVCSLSALPLQITKGY